MALRDINARALWWAGPLTVAVAVLLVIATREVAFRLLDLPAGFPPLTWQGLIFFTVVGVGLGVLVFAVVAMFSSTPIRTYRKIALVVLVLSMLPDAWLPGNVPGATWPAAIVLMVTHIAAWAPTVFLLTNPKLIAARRVT
jgi:hypothetical protein